jgi:hypothetical protein
MRVTAWNGIIRFTHDQIMKVSEALLLPDA